MKKLELFAADGARLIPAVTIAQLSRRLLKRVDAGPKSDSLNASTELLRRWLALKNYEKGSSGRSAKALLLQFKDDATAARPRTIAQYRASF